MHCDRSRAGPDRIQRLARNAHVVPVCGPDLSQFKSVRAAASGGVQLSQGGFDQNFGFDRLSGPCGADMDAHGPAGEEGDAVEQFPQQDHRRLGARRFAGHGDLGPCKASDHSAFRSGADQRASDICQQRIPGLHPLHPVQRTQPGG